MNISVESVKKDLKKYATKKRALVLQKYFKTGVGEYGYGDIFLGLTVPQVRLVAKQNKNCGLSIIQTLLASKVHEERQTALAILSLKAQKLDGKELEKLHKFYLKNLGYVNNWDLVDGSAEILVGKYLANRGNKNLLVKLAKSKNMWSRRVAIIATFYFIKSGSFNETLKIANLLLKDQKDLIHKAVGWMLREVGKRAMAVEENFLRDHYKHMPRTMLRYAIEKFPQALRLKYLHGQI